MDERTLAVLCCGLTLTAPAAVAQRAQTPVHSGENVESAAFAPGVGANSPRAFARASGVRPAVMLTGYWPPTNEMLRRFSPNPAQNPLGWIGQDWEGRGYDVYAYFPEFDTPSCNGCPKGEGDLEVDYQDTSNDFWALANALQPIAIITFSRGAIAPSWELEMNQYNRSVWIDDYLAPLQPTPAPPDASVAPGALRLSALPVQEIVDNVLDMNVNVTPAICFSGDGGGFLSEFIAYHGVWYQDLHSSPQDPAWCVAAGHVHVGLSLNVTRARRAAEVTLRTVLHHVDRVLEPTCQDVDLYCATTVNTVGRGAQLWSTGALSLAANELELLVVEAPPSVNAQLFYGPGRAQTPFGSGSMCVAPPLVRIPPPRTTDASGFLAFPLDFTLAPFASGPAALLAGSTWNFQCMYRDPTSTGGATFDLTNGLEATFCP